MRDALLAVFLVVIIVALIARQANNIESILNDLREPTADLDAGRRRCRARGMDFGGLVEVEPGVTVPVCRPRWGQP